MTLRAKPLAAVVHPHGVRKVRAFATHEERIEADGAVRDAFIGKSADLADDFPGFWKYEPDVPDELRPSIGRWQHIDAPEPLKSESVERRGYREAPQSSESPTRLRCRERSKIARDGGMCK